MSEPTLDEALEELESAEDFLEYFAVAFDPAVVQVNRLHILQRFHDYLQQREAMMPEAGEARRTAYARLLQQAYQDFVDSSGPDQKVFKVFRRQAVREIFVPLADLIR